MSSRPIPASDEALLTALETAVQSFSSHDGVPSDLCIDHAYIFGSRGNGTERDDSDLDVLLSMTTEEPVSEDEFVEVCEDLQSHILWEHTEDILDASELDLDTSKQNLDVVVYPDGIAQWELDSYMEHAGYQNAYSLTQNNYLY